MTIFCPLCKSIMKDGICTNRECGNTKLETDFKKFINDIKYFPKNRINYINNAYLQGLFVFSQTGIYDFRQEIFGGTLKDLKTLIENNVNINVKVVNYIVNEEKIEELEKRLTVSGIRYFTLKQARKIPKIIFKHYIEYYTISSLGKTLDNAIVFGSNDLINWYPAGFNSIEKDNKEIGKEKIEGLIDIGLTKLKLWTLQITDIKSGIKINTFFTKEQAYLLFKDREIKYGKKKRTALKHIVNDYERNIPKKVLVKEHLRGDMEFEWRGINFKLYVPLVDELRIECKKLERMNS